MLNGAIQDVRHTLRGLIRAPGFALAAILTLTLGIGVTTAIVSIVDHVVFHSLPFRDADRLMVMLERSDRGGFRPPSAPTVADWKQDEPGMIGPPRCSHWSGAGKSVPGHSTS